MTRAVRFVGITLSPDGLWRGHFRRLRPCPGNIPSSIDEISWCLVSVLHQRQNWGGVLVRKGKQNRICRVNRSNVYLYIFPLFLFCFVILFSESRNSAFWAHSTNVSWAEIVMRKLIVNWLSYVRLVVQDLKKRTRRIWSKAWKFSYKVSFSCRTRSDRVLVWFLSAPRLKTRF